MSQFTPNYGLYLEDNDATNFRDWREEMDGTNDSNMVKIDTALGEKANSSVEVSGVLLSSEWSGENAPYTQELSVSGMTATQNGTIALALNATAEQREAARAAMLYIVSQADGVLVIGAEGDCPTVDIPVTTILLG